MTAKKRMTREEIERGRDEYLRERKEKFGDAISWGALLPDPWTVLLQREKDNQTLQ